MKLNWITPVFLLLAASTAHAGALITLSPTNPGPYLGGESVGVDLYVTTDQDIQVRLWGFDFSQTDPKIRLSGPTGSDSTMDFLFDYGTLAIAGLYATFPNFPTPVSVYASGTPVPGFIRELNSGVPDHTGDFFVTLPTEPGTYTLDAANYSTEDTNHGALIMYDFAATQMWSTLSDGNVEITGGTFDFVVVPEPATLILLTIGGLAVSSFSFRRSR